MPFLVVFSQSAWEFFCEQTGEGSDEICRREREIFTAFCNNSILLNENSILERMKDVAGERDLQERAGK